MPTDSLADQDVAKLPSPGEVICVLKKQSPTEDIYEIFSLEQGEKDGKSSFALRRQSYSKSDAGENETLQYLVENFGTKDLPVHLQPAQQRRLHVVVSTHSGTGLSTHFYENSLAPLLEVFGLTASGELEQGGTEQQGSYHLLITQNAESVKDFARGLAAFDRNEKNIEHTVVLLSGDGGVVDILNAYTKDNDDTTSGQDTDSQNQPLIAVLPLGTGNALFHSLNKTVKTQAASDLVQGLRTLLRGRAAPLPSFKATFPEGSRTITYSETPDPTPTVDGSTSVADPIPNLGEQTEYVTHLYGVVVASYGFHSQLVWESDTPEYRKHGAKRFQMVAAELLKESHAYRATVEINRSYFPADEEIIGVRELDRDRHAYILVTPVSNLEKTFCISPDSRPLDGKLRIVHFGPVDGAKTMEIMMAAYDGGKHVDMRWEGTKAQGQDGEVREERVGYHEINEVRITTHEGDARWRKVCIDGTIVEIPSEGFMVVSKEARRHLRVLVDGSTAPESAL
ncbi:ATP-NAD kinase-like domain-containing protein [Xylaria digitata]|nr:ATP-NAD kinase-like domain-containing protein [Xylaria digitata]